MRAYPLARKVFLPFMKLWIGEINGIEHIPRNGGFVVAANHASYMDHPIIMASLLPVVDRKIHFLAKREHFDTFYKRWWHNYAGAIPIDRQRGGRDGLEKGREILEQEEILAIHPEGTRSSTGRLLRAKTGTAWLTLHAHVPLLPIGLIGTFDILPKGKKLPKLIKAKVNIGKPMDFSAHYAEKISKSTLDLVTLEIMKEIARLSGQDYPSA